MEERFATLTELLGADNKQRLTDGIVDLILAKTKDDLDQYFEYDYCFNMDDLFESVVEKVKEKVWDDLYDLYYSQIKAKIDKRLGGMRYEDEE